MEDCQTDLGGKRLTLSSITFMMMMMMLLFTLALFTGNAADEGVRVKRQPRFVITWADQPQMNPGTILRRRLKPVLFPSFSFKCDGINWLSSDSIIPWTGLRFGKLGDCSGDHG